MRKEMYMTLHVNHIKTNSLNWIICVWLTNGSEHLYPNYRMALNFMPWNCIKLQLILWRNEKKSADFGFLAVLSKFDRCFKKKAFHRQRRCQNCLRRPTWHFTIMLTLNHRKPLLWSFKGFEIVYCANHIENVQMSNN